MAAADSHGADVQPPHPHISIVIPIYNEQAILHAAIVDLRERLAPLGWSYEIILAENGSKDRRAGTGRDSGARSPTEARGKARLTARGGPNSGRRSKQAICSRGETS